MNIYELNYDSLVKSPREEISSLIDWLGWEWNETYLAPENNSRSVFTRSNVEVRLKINSKSLNNWKNYKEMLSPAIDIITSQKKYSFLIN